MVSFFKAETGSNKPFCRNACRPAWPGVRGKERVLEQDRVQCGAVESCWGWLGVHVLLLVPAALAEGDVVDTTELLVLFLTINVVGKGGKMQLYC